MKKKKEDLSRMSRRDRHRIAQGTRSLMPCLLLAMGLGACTSYGWSSRPDARSPHGLSGPLTLAQIVAPADRHIDVRLATTHMESALSRCGVTPDVGAQREDVAHMLCQADSSTSRGAGQALWADITLLCTVSLGDTSHPFTLRSQRMIAPAELTSAQLATAQHNSDTDALLDAIDHLSCRQLDGAPLGTTKEFQ